MALAPGPVDTGFHHAMGAELSFYRQLVLALSADQTARAAYRGYVLGLRLVVPGITAKLLQIALWIIPHAVALAAHRLAAAPARRKAMERYRR